MMRDPPLDGAFHVNRALAWSIALNDGDGREGTVMTGAGGGVKARVEYSTSSTSPDISLTLEELHSAYPPTS